jgi:UDP-N-acetylmuramate dehydrogenase
VTGPGLVAPRVGEQLSSWTSLGLGGPAQYFVEVHSLGELEEALRWAGENTAPVHILGGGSNLVVADRGVTGLVIRMATTGVRIVDSDEDVVLSAAAGTSWDEVVAESVEAGLAGLECLAGIPGTAGATPIQNVGAYGVEISDVLDGVHVLDRITSVHRRLGPAECGFGYRASRFRNQPDRFVITGIDLRLRPKGQPVIRYPELERAVSGRAALPSPADVRSVVLELRRNKGMVLDDDLPGSVGSFFVNPIVDAAGLARAESGVEGGDRLPRFEAGDGFKLPAAWLIEHSGFERGYRDGPVGLSDHHVLALVHLGGGRTADLLELAGRIRRRVQEVFGMTLQPEPVFWGVKSERNLGEV